MLGPVTGGGRATGGGTGAFGLQPQPVAGGDNDLTQYLRSVGNLLGATGGGLLPAGTGLVGGGTGVAQGGVDLSQLGFGTTQQGLATMQPSVDFYTKILSGDPTATTQALAPTAANIATITSGATNQASQGMPAGGYRAATLAGLPFAQAAQVGNAALALQPAAAAALTGIGGEQARIGGLQGEIGQAIARTGIDIGQLGTQLTSQGITALADTVNALLKKGEINVQETGNLLSALL